MFCSNCGKQNTDNAKFCANCGATITDQPNPQYTAPPPQPQYSPPPQAAIHPPSQYTAPPRQTAQPPFQGAPAVVAKHTSGFAITSLIFGIIGGTLLAIIFGAIALSQIGKNPNLSGRGLAITGIVLGILWMIILVIIIVAGAGL